MKKYLFLALVQLVLLSCQPKKTETNNSQPSTSTADSARPETIPADRTVTRLDSVGDAASSPAPTPAPNKGENPGTSWQISKSQIGPIQIGMAVNAMRKRVPAEFIKEIPITREGRGNRAYEIRQSPGEQKAGLLIEETCEPTCQVWRVHVQNPAYKTKEGLGVGSTLGEVKKHYKISYLGAGETEIVAVSDDAKLTFMLDVSKVPAKQVPRLNLKNTPDSTPIIGMLIL
ncbi:hypothetical protein [Adhaeribacter pallidiroseus]|uniref:Uncharacterized protein n=1 Tax=Adhaeribacter pallidiroseus TaxID=2072847 RepID=A0A369QSG2_9BACT|nr:hypothetical protein [Adhaeribacter pallidiroseus]RDC65108.1 hypothetical protein AHMF7616_03732 [Adhaeribacter pallidiroseus]